MKKILLHIFGVFAVVASMITAKGMTLNLVYDGDPSLYPTNMSDFTNVIGAAAHYLTAPFPNDHHIKTIHVQISTNTFEGILGQEFINAEGGTPNEITGSTIVFNANAPWFIDKTPYDNSEFSNYVEHATDLGGGIINTTRSYESGPNGIDLLSDAEHEMGHVVGGLDGNLNTFYQQVITNNCIHVQASLPFAGTVIGVQAYYTNQDGFVYYNGCTSYIDQLPNVTSGAIGIGMRNLLSDSDIMAMAQIGHLNVNPTLNITNVNGCVVLTWTPTVGNWQLLESTDLKSWTPSQLNANIINNNGMFTVVTSPTGGQKFFKLTPVPPPTPATPPAQPVG